MEKISYCLVTRKSRVSIPDNLKEEVQHRAYRIEFGDFAVSMSSFIPLKNYRTCYRFASLFLLEIRRRTITESGFDRLMIHEWK